jgi:tryptophanase
VRQHGADKVSYVSLEFSVNMAGGQPVGMDNLREVYAYGARKGIPVTFDATRAVENAYCIQQKDVRYRSTPGALAAQLSRTTAPERRTLSAAPRRENEAS